MALYNCIILINETDKAKYQETSTNMMVRIRITKFESMFNKNIEKDKLIEKTSSTSNRQTNNKYVKHDHNKITKPTKNTNTK